MTKDKFLSIFCSKRRLLCLLSFKFFFATLTVLKTGEYHLGHIWSQDTSGAIASERKYLIRHDISTVDKDSNWLVDMVTA